MPFGRYHSSQIKDAQRKINKIRQAFFWIIITFVIVFLLAYSIFQDGISRFVSLSEQQQQQSLKEKVSMAVNAVQPVLNEFRNKKINRETALIKIRSIGKTLVYQDEFGKNYIFINQQDGLVLVRPYKPEDELKNLWYLKDSQGGYSLQTVINAVKKKPEGAYMKYLYINPGNNLEEPKLSYAVLIPELNIHIGTGTYQSQILKDQIKLAHKLFWWGVSLVLLLLFPFIVVMLFLKRIKAIMISGQVDQKSLENIKKDCNLKAFINKPWKQEELLSAVKKCVEE